MAHLSLVFLTPPFFLAQLPTALVPAPMGWTEYQAIFPCDGNNSWSSIFLQPLFTGNIKSCSPISSVSLSHIFFKPDLWQNKLAIKTITAPACSAQAGKVLRGLFRAPVLLFNTSLFIQYLLLLLLLPLDHCCGLGCLAASFAPWVAILDCYHQCFYMWRA